MSDRLKIIIALAAFLALAGIPLWYNAFPGKAGVYQQPVLPAGKKECVGSKEFMRANHMLLLAQWRDEVVREGDRRAIPVEGRQYPKSLSSGCFDCHSNKSKFCDRCHNYLGVSPRCFDCHIEPKEESHAAQ